MKARTPLTTSLGLSIHALANDAEVFHYRDARGLECDAIVERGDGRWGVVEIKLESRGVDRAIETLAKVGREVQSQHSGKAAFLAVITTGGHAYQRDDGICMIPISCLRP